MVSKRQFDELKEEIREIFGNDPTSDQAIDVELWSAFIREKEVRHAQRIKVGLYLIV